MAVKKRSSSKEVILDMTGVEKGGKRRFPEGDYVVKITAVAKTVNKNSGNSQLKVTYEILEGSQKGNTIVDYMALTEKALWRVGNLLDALGIKWSPKKFKLPIDKLVGSVLGITLVDDEYQGKIKSKVADFLDEETARGGDDDEDDDEDEDDEDVEEDEDEDEDDDDVDELDDDDL